MPGVSITVSVTGAEELAKRLGASIDPGTKAASRQAAYELSSAFDTYPPQTIANDPAQPRWYERLWGSRWRRKDGSIGGRHTSERLYFKWKIEQVGNGARISNTASYAGWVQGNKQTKVMKRIGWKTYKDVLTVRMQKKITDMYAHAITWKIIGRSI